jgi:hypothetical protein
MDGDYWVKLLAIRNEDWSWGGLQSTGKTRLHHAAMTGDVERIGQLLEVGAFVDAAWEFHSQVRDSRRYGAAASIDYLNEWRMEISTQLKITPASLAVAFGQKAAYHALLERGASPSLFEVFPSPCYGVYEEIFADGCRTSVSCRQALLSDEAKVNRHSLLLYLAGAGRVPHARLLKADLAWGLLDIVTLTIDGGIKELNEELDEWVNQDAFMKCFMEHTVGYCVQRTPDYGNKTCWRQGDGNAFAKVVFPRISCDHRSEMMLHCGNTALRDLLRQLVGFPDTLDDRLAAPGYREGYCERVEKIQQQSCTWHRLNGSASTVLMEALDPLLPPHTHKQTLKTLLRSPC